MSQMNAICGLPRSGSTLLSNILAQNPDFHVSSTSPMPWIAELLSRSAAENPEIQAEAIRTGNSQRFGTLVRGAIMGWYSGYLDKKAIFDKGRYWSNMGPLFQYLFPDGHLFVMVRDLRAVVASIERRHRETAIISSPGIAPGLPLRDRISMALSPTGLVGMTVNGILDLKDRGLNNVHFVQYESLAANPGSVLHDIYAAIGLPTFEHDFQNVVSVNEDIDGMYWHKFPHTGGGKVSPADPKDWMKHLTPEIGKDIQAAFPRYVQMFGY